MRNSITKRFEAVYLFVYLCVRLANHSFLAVRRDQLTFYFKKLITKYGTELRTKYEFHIRKANTSLDDN